MKRGRKVKWHVVAVVGLVGLFGIVVLQNTQVVRIQLLFWNLTMSRIILLLVSVLVGFVVGVYVMWRLRRPSEVYAKLGDGRSSKHDRGSSPSDGS